MVEIESFFFFFLNHLLLLHRVQYLSSTLPFLLTIVLVSMHIVWVFFLWSKCGIQTLDNGFGRGCQYHWANSSNPMWCGIHIWGNGCKKFGLVLREDQIFKRIFFPFYFKIIYPKTNFFCIFQWGTI